MRFKLRAVIALVAVLSLSAAACGDDDSGGNEPAGAAEDGGSAGSADADFTIGLGLSGPRDDQAYYQALFEGVTEKSGELGVELTAVDNLVDPQAQNDTLRNLADTNELVVVDVFFMGAVLAMASQFPDVTFIVASGEFKPGEVENAHAYVPRYGYISYVMGTAASLITETKKIGYIAGPSFPGERQAMAGFKQGIEDSDPSITFTDTTVNSYTDVAVAKAAATAMIDSGVDTIYGYIDAGFEGLIQAAEESGKDIKLFSLVLDRCDRSDHVVGNHIVDYSGMIASTIDDYMSGNLPDGTKSYKLDDPTIHRFGTCDGDHKAAMDAKAEETIAAIESGEVELSSEISGES